MIFLKDCNIYATVWDVKKSDKYIDLQVTTSEKDQEGNYVNSGWFPRLIGHAFNSMKDNLPQKGDRILITKAKLSNERYKAQDDSIKSHFHFLVLEAQILKKKGEDAAETKESAPKQEKSSSEGNDACPW